MKTFVADRPRQENNVDCGVFVCQYAKFLSRYQQLALTQESKRKASNHCCSAPIELSGKEIEIIVQKSDEYMEKRDFKSVKSHYILEFLRIDEKIPIYVPIDDGDMATLYGERWLTDAIVTSYLQLIANTCKK